ncbi:CaiF/GrlA family transcriptional regulator [Rahnella aceris]|uniref:CaiF/GrlA family transcriptional regulator n=1 Tax=Rahnella sp. (strain Y9602) TaxID=2703885 RepID=UPI001C273950|nr:CaiF/GrlA family transcriptional regulator [Rahnella aceris]MBU9839044.1 CaiF/GrlA family transcriptional regulator [Rahnella aceris]
MSERNCNSTTIATRLNIPDAPVNVIAGKQSNHGEYHLPQELLGINAPTLYLAVAHWGLRKGAGFTRDEISKVFRITLRRAADVMTYITTAKSDVVNCETRLVSSVGGRRSLVMTVTAIHEAPERGAGKQAVAPRADSKKKAESEARIRQIHLQFLTRPAAFTTR